MSDVFLNGKFIGYHENGRGLAELVKERRRKGEIPYYVNVYYSEEEDTVYIFSNHGRVRRPLIVVKDGKPLLTDEMLEKLEKGEMKWSDLVKQGVIEYLDANEEENAYVALYPEDLTKEHTHLEISPMVIFGTQANMLPFAQHALSPKVLIGAKMIKQGIALYTKNFTQRMDTDSSLLHYPQKPIVQTLMYKYINYDSCPAGQNVVIAVMPFQGYNMDDAIVMNKSSTERGLFRSSYYRPYVAEELRYPGGQKDRITIPDKDVVGYRTEEEYRYLEEDGIIYPSAEVKGGDVLIGKVSPPRFLTSLDEFTAGIEANKETSEAVRFGEKGVVETVLITETEDGNKYVKVKVRDLRPPELGDKFASRHGQKGVIGMLVPQEDMPFTASGVIPDIIFNPHSIPSRMTINHLLEILAGKVGALAGRYVDGTPFAGEKEFDLRKELLKLGFRDDGLETMYNGMTGEEFKARIFVGNMYYLKLKYMVANKLHARSRGPVQLLTRQPTEGRSKEGGLRLGEMEKDCFIAHGAALALKERFDSDKVVVPVCKNCGIVAVYNRYRDIGICPICGEEAPITFVEMSYAFKLLLDELKSLCIYPKLIITPKG